jgi:hypothetical protein
MHWKLYAVLVSSVMGLGVWTAAVLSFWKPIVRTLERWLISAGKGTGEIVCPMCGQSVGLGPEPAITVNMSTERH